MAKHDRTMKRSQSGLGSAIGAFTCKAWRRLWRDDAGAILSTEIILVAVVAVIGLVAGLASIRDSMVSELADVGGSIQDLNQSFSITGSCYERDIDGNITISFAVPPTAEGQYVPPDTPDPAEPHEPEIVHTVSDSGNLVFDSVNTGIGGSVTGTLSTPTGVSTGFTSTTDTGQVLGTNGENISFRESPSADGTFTTTFDDPIADLEFFINGLYGGPDRNVVGNFTVTLSDGTVLNNAAFTVLPDTISPNSAVGSFTTDGLSTELASTISSGGADYVYDATDNGTRNQVAGRIVFTDVPPPGDDCIGIVSVSFDRFGGPPNFTAYYSFSGSVIEIQP